APAPVRAPGPAAADRLTGPAPLSRSHIHSLTRRRGRRACAPRSCPARCRGQTTAPEPPALPRPPAARKEPTMAEQGIPVIGPLLNRIIGTRNERFVKRYTQRVEAINGLEQSVRQMTDAQIRAMLAEFRDRLAKGTKPDDLLDEAF